MHQSPRVTSSKVASFSNPTCPHRAPVLCHSTLCGLLPGVFTQCHAFLCPPQSSLLRFSSSSPSPFHLGAMSYEMRSSILAAVLMVLEIELWAIDLHTPGPKMRPPMRTLAVPRAASQNWALGSSCLSEHRALLHGRGFSLFSCPHPPLPLTARRDSLDQV